MPEQILIGHKKNGSKIELPYNGGESVKEAVALGMYKSGCVLVEEKQEEQKGRKIRFFNGEFTKICMVQNGESEFMIGTEIKSPILNEEKDRTFSGSYSGCVLLCEQLVKMEDENINTRTNKLAKARKDATETLKMLKDSLCGIPEESFDYIAGNLVSETINSMQPQSREIFCLLLANSIKTLG